MNGGKYWGVVRKQVDLLQVEPFDSFYKALESITVPSDITVYSDPVSVVDFPEHNIVFKGIPKKWGEDSYLIFRMLQILGE